MDTGRGAGIPACAGMVKMPLRGAQRFIPPLAKGAKGDFAIPMKIGIQVLSCQLAATKGGRSIPVIVIAKLRSNCGNLVPMVSMLEATMGG